MAAMAALAPKPDPVARKPAAGALKALKKDRLPRRRSVSQICPPPRRPMTLGELSRGGENERVGVVRETMLQNHLIAKPEVGKPRRSCYTLPGYAFNYGLYLHGVDGGVAEAIGHWNAIKPRPPSAKTRGRDYVTMSRRAIQEGYVTPHEQHLYRKLKEIHLSDDDERRFKRNPPNVPADMTYGRPARPSTPFFDLLQHKYKEIWLDEQRAVIQAKQEENKQKSRRGKVYETRTSLLRKHQPPIPMVGFWHMPHFQKKAGPHLSTFPDEEAQRKAFALFRAEIPVRTGLFAQGLYTSA
ncbi:cilia- and flagella-associated protein 77 isoform X1 [Hemicordylus capensis]|uniref:cilia- and flagella-associated protein 77 isoform X1 n=1 Tax=Hemicordylus capensis TaxID=884348 RepID=UPI002302E08A|nr:cilia- and flagella-associated protein 77 isoform X1 [Hemicordylus capensis]